MLAQKPKTTDACPATPPWIRNTLEQTSECIPHLHCHGRTVTRLDVVTSAPSIEPDIFCGTPITETDSLGLGRALGKRSFGEAIVDSRFSGREVDETALFPHPTPENSRLAVLRKVAPSHPGFVNSVWSSCFVVGQPGANSLSSGLGSFHRPSVQFPSIPAFLEPDSKMSIFVFLFPATEFARPWNPPQPTSVSNQLLR